MKEILNKVLSKITPTEEEHEQESFLIAELMALLEKEKVSPILVGSNAKDTDLSGDKDIDIFIRFPAKTSRKRLEERGLEVGKKLFTDLSAKWEIDYAEHPYVKGVVKGYDIEIVPCYMGKKILSSVDRTPFHTEFVRKKLRENPKLRGEIRLLKQFMKANKVYGAEAKVQGFSGYLVELLTIHHGSFVRTLRAVQDWEFTHTIDPEGLWEDPNSLKHVFTKAVLIVVDPVDKDRNVAAAVSKQKLAEFIVAAKEFLDEPSEKKFLPKKKLESRGSKLVAITFKHGKINENSLYSQLRRTSESLVKTVEDYGFKIFRTGFWTNETDYSIILLEFEVWELPKIMHHRGPPISMDAVHQERFKEKYESEEPYIKDGHWVVDTKRKYTKIEKLTPQILKEKRGFGKQLRNSKLDTLSGEKVVDLEGLEYRKYLTEFL